MSNFANDYNQEFENWTAEEQEAAAFGRGLALFMAGNWTLNADRSIDEPSVKWDKDSHSYVPNIHHCTVEECSCHRGQEVKTATLLAKITKVASPLASKCLHYYELLLALNEAGPTAEKLGKEHHKIMIGQEIWQRGKLQERKAAAERPPLVVDDATMTLGPVKKSASVDTIQVSHPSGFRVPRGTGFVILPYREYRVPSGATTTQCFEALKAQYKRNFGVDVTCKSTAQYPGAFADSLTVVVLD